jgi:uncharacterized membrane protein (DUF485 family)
MNTDISGIGVRLSFYLQTLFLGKYLSIMGAKYIDDVVQVACLLGRNRLMRLWVLSTLYWPPTQGSL